jgi:hypothetical protein
LATGSSRNFANDGANEANGYMDTTGWTPVNPPMVVDRLGTNATNVDIWQQLNLSTAETQNGIVLETSVQPYIGAHWREVEPFAVTRDMTSGLYGDPMGTYPSIDDAEMVDWVVQVIQRTAHLDVDDGVMIDISPTVFGNNPLGSDDGTGYGNNPVTGHAVCGQHGAARRLRACGGRVLGGWPGLGDAARSLGRARHRHQR